MNPSYLGDSYDLVKRFFCGQLVALGYGISVNPMFTGTWSNTQQGSFYRLIGARASSAPHAADAGTALFLDPDTGINAKGGKQHISFDYLANEASKYDLVFVFDQSFSRQLKAEDIIQVKLAELGKRGLFGMYYDSHARFLFVTSREERLGDLRSHLITLGLPDSRLKSRTSAESPL